MNKVLVVDDQADIRRLINWSLEVLDVEIHEAINGERALRMVRTIQPALLIVDVMMPGDIDGLEVCRRIKAEAGQTAPRIILLSARGQVADVEVGLAAGADAYLVKPFSPQRLVEAAERLLKATA